MKSPKIAPKIQIAHTPESSNHTSQSGFDWCVTCKQPDDSDHTLSSANAKLGFGAYDGAGNQASPAGHVPAIESTGTSLNYSDQTPNTSAALAYGNGAATDLAGSNIPVPIMPPYLCVNFVIATVGIFPSRN